MNMKKIFLVLFIMIPLITSGVIFLAPDRSISENENRTLISKADISFNFASGDFQSDLESYLCDQFLLRDAIVSAKSELFVLLGKKDINGAYIGNNRLIEKITNSDIDVTSCKRSAQALNALAEEYGLPAYALYVPSAEIMLSDELPDNAVVYNYDELYSTLCDSLTSFEMIDCRQALSDPSAYYRTDHHWTCSGAYSAYKEWCRAHGDSPREFDVESVTDDFRGTLYSKALPTSTKPESIEAPVITDKISITADGAETKLYDYSALETKDKYNFFQGGNHGVVVIENKSGRSGRVLLIVKDSFANSLVPYLVSDYDKIIMLDERYTFMTPDDIIEKEGVTELAIVKQIIS